MKAFNKYAQSKGWPKKGVGNFGLAAFGRKVFYGIDNLD